METGQLVISTVVTFFDAADEQHEKEVILFERIGIDEAEARNYVACFRRQQPTAAGSIGQLVRDEIFAVWTRQVVL